MSSVDESVAGNANQDGEKVKNTDSTEDNNNLDVRSVSVDAVESSAETEPLENIVKQEDVEDEREKEQVSVALPVTDNVTAQSKSFDAASRSSAEDRSFDNSDDLLVIDTESTPSVDTKQPAAMSVTPRRKEELLMEARSDRLRWIQNVPLPYEKQQNGDRVTSFLEYSHVATELPAFKSVLEHLYGHTTDRIEAALEQCTDDDKHIYLTGNQILAAEIAAMDDDPDTKAALEAYQFFLNQLQDPASGVLVQGMRTFCRNFQDITDKEEAASRLKAYVTATVETLKQHAAFRQQDDKDGQEAVQRSLVSFLLGQCRSHIYSLFWTADASTEEEAFQEKLRALQFVTPAHLDIACFAGNDDLVDELLVEPVKALLAVDSYHSVYEKLQQILALFRGVNAALAAALNKDSDDDNKKLPSADDVLPTIILTVLRAKPVRLLLTLQLIEDFSPPQYLRGEAGYAYTNLYSAIKFLQDLDLDKEPTSLSISASAFQEGIAASKAAAEERLRKIAPTEDDFLFSDSSTEEETLKVPLPHEIRTARLRGESIDVEWALQWQQQQQQQQQQNGDGNTDTTLTPGENVAVSVEALEDQLPFPANFRRNYSFLGARPEDIRVTDLSQLLEEYRALVHTTETLLAERTLQAAADRKAKQQKLESDLLATARGIDPALLPTLSTGRKTKDKERLV